MRNQVQKNLIKIGREKREEKEEKNIKKELGNAKRELSRQLTLKKKKHTILINCREKLKEHKEKLEKMTRKAIDQATHLSECQSTIEHNKITIKKAQEDRDVAEKTIKEMNGLLVKSLSDMDEKEKKSEKTINSLKVTIKQLKKSRQKRKLDHKREIKKLKQTIASLNLVGVIAVIAQVIAIITLLLNK